MMQDPSFAVHDCNGRDVLSFVQVSNGPGHRVCDSSLDLVTRRRSEAQFLDLHAQPPRVVGNAKIERHVAV